MKVVIVSAFTPFIQSSAQSTAARLAVEFQQQGCQVDQVLLPFNDNWRRLMSQYLAFRSLELEEAATNPIDRLVCLGYPAHAVPHPNKVVWFTGYPPILDSEDPEAQSVKESLLHADSKYLHEAKRLYTTSKVAASLLKTHSGLENAGVLYPPPFQPAEQIYGEPGTYLVCTNPITPANRLDLAIRAMTHMKGTNLLIFTGETRSMAYLNSLMLLARENHLEGFVLFKDEESEERRAEILAGSCGVLDLSPGNEPFENKALEGFYFQKPVIVLKDSRLAGEVVTDLVNGFVSLPIPEVLASVMRRLMKDKTNTHKMGENAREFLNKHAVNWTETARRLLE